MKKLPIEVEWFNIWAVYYSGYVIEHFPMMERESTRLALKFSSTIDDTVEYAQAKNMSDDDFRIAVNNALCDHLV